jgi:hypothetical protein
MSKMGIGMRSYKFLGDVALHGSEHEQSLGIAFDDKKYGSITEPTHTIKNNDMMCLVRHLSSSNVAGSCTFLIRP